MHRGITALAWVLYVTGLVHACLLVRRHLLGRYGVYILSYHHVVSAKGGRVSRHDVTVSQLESHLAFVRKWFRVASLEDIPALLSAGRLDRDYVAITFDDGYEDNYHEAFPLLRRHACAATVFLIAGLTGASTIPWYDECLLYLAHLETADLRGSEAPATPLLSTLASIMSARRPLEDRLERALAAIKSATPDQRDAVLAFLRTCHGQSVPDHRLRSFGIMTWEQAREMALNGVSFGCHTMTHPILTTLNAAEIDAEVHASKTLIERQLGRACQTFAFPNGDFDDRSLDVLRGHGFIAACTQLFGPNRTGADPLTLNRIGMGRTPLFVLTAKLSGVLAPIYAFRRWRQTWEQRRRGSLRMPSEYRPHA